MRYVRFFDNRLFFVAGCGDLSSCNNTYGGFTCTPYFIPDSLETPDPVLSANPLVFADTRAGQRFRARVSMVTLNATELQLYFGGRVRSIPFAKIFQCGPTSLVGVIDPTVRVCSYRSLFRFDVKLD